jgi:hypothetical protein
MFEIEKQRKSENIESEKLADLILDILKRKELLNREGVGFEKEVDVAYEDLKELLKNRGFCLTDPETLRRVRDLISKEMVLRGGIDKALSNVLDAWSMIEEKIEREKINLGPDKNKPAEKYTKFTV